MVNIFPESEEQFTKAEVRELMKEAYMEGYALGEDVEELQNVAIRTAESRFERWYALNYEKCEEKGPL